MKIFFTLRYFWISILLLNINIVVEHFLQLLKGPFALRKLVWNWKPENEKFTTSQNIDLYKNYIILYIL